MFKNWLFHYRQNKTDKEILNILPIFESYLKMRDLKAFKNWDSINYTINSLKNMILSASLNDKDLELIFEILSERLEEVNSLNAYISIHILPKERKINKKYTNSEEWWFYYNRCYDDIICILFNKIRNFLGHCKVEKQLVLQQEWEKEFPKQIKN